MKKRTQIAARIYFWISLYCLAGLIVVLMNLKHNPIWLPLQLSPWAIAWFFWLALLNGRACGWWVLTIFHGAVVLWLIWGLAHAPSYLRTHHSHPSIMWMVVVDCLVAAFYITPIWVLLTDRPSGWNVSGRACASQQPNEMP